MFPRFFLQLRQAVEDFWVPQHAKGVRLTSSEGPATYFRRSLQCDQGSPEFVYGGLFSVSPGYLVTGDRRRGYLQHLQQCFGKYLQEETHLSL